VVNGRKSVQGQFEYLDTASGSFLRQHAATTPLCDFFTVDSVLLRRLYALAFISIPRSRHVRLLGKHAAIRAHTAADRASPWRVLVGRREYRELL
jgi:hypothetical protein